MQAQLDPVHIIFELKKLKLKVKMLQRENTQIRKILRPDNPRGDNEDGENENFPKRPHESLDEEEKENLSSRKSLNEDRSESFDFFKAMELSLMDSSVSSSSKVRLNMSA